jgi:nucleoside-diphosphate-sugar epimerase
MFQEECLSPGDRVLVTGGAGFIGSHLTEALVERGYRVRVLDNLTSGHHDWVPRGAEFLEGDIRDLEVCQWACEGCNGIFHMAAMSRSAASLDAVELCTSSNVVGTQNILLAARDHKVGKVVYSGSSTFYGSRSIPHVEGMRPDFLNLYGLSKATGEEYCLLFDRLYGVPAIVLRYFNVYGPRQPEQGAYALVLGIFLRRWLEGRTLVIHGDGMQSRDFVHVSDVVRANIRAYESTVHGETINIGSGRAISVRELADLISPLQEFGPARQGDAAHTLADVTRARDLLGWKPGIRFEDGLRELKELMQAQSDQVPVIA